MDSPTLRKARGAFFTPPEISRSIAQWAVRGPADVVLEPSCGEAAFLLPAAQRLRELGAPPDRLGAQVEGIEIHSGSATAAGQRLRAAGAASSIRVGDFFDHEPAHPVDAVIGNPPYVRYQNFSGEARAKGLRVALAQGVRLTGLASSWAAFTIHAARFLKPDGRLGLVLPAELLTVNYAAEVRRFLLGRFAKVRLVLFERRVFPGVMEEVVLLLAEGSGGAAAFEVYQARDLDDLSRLETAAWTGYTPRGDDKWTSALLPADSLDAFRALTEGAGFAVLLDWGETYLGAVTGNNAFFTLTDAEVSEWRIPERELLPISPPGARHLRGLEFSEAAWRQLATDGKRCLLFRPGDKPSAAAKRYIAAGEAAKVQLGYKCSNRSPWWRVPLVQRPDLLLTYMNQDRPRLMSNTAGVHLLNSVYGVSLRPELRDLGRELLPAACLNSATLLGAEMVGRAYGGGLLKHEPKEADLLPVPAPATLAAAAKALRRIMPQITTALRGPAAERAVDLVDRAVLEEGLGLARTEIDGLRRARAVLMQRRVSRGRG
jgi:adenine-specific DNA methylase